MDCEALKWCSTCKNRKRPTAFHKNSNAHDGLSYTCKDCRREYASAYYKENSGKLIEYSRQWRAANPDKFRESKRRHEADNAEATRARRRRYEKNNREQINAANSRWRRNNAEAYRAIKSRRRARENNAATAPFDADDLARRWAYFGNKCWMCSGVATETDHVKPLAKGGAHMLCNMRPICKPCNSGKRDTWPIRGLTLTQKNRDTI